jgi:hypothetical protein
MFVSSLREFPENCVYNHCGLDCFIEYLHRKLLTGNIFLLWYWKCIYWICILKQYISCSKTVYLILAKNDQTFWYKSVISSVEVYDKEIITCHCSYHTVYQPLFIYHPLSISALGLISWPRADKGYDMKNAM